jgi:hypothetical protein
MVPEGIHVAPEIPIDEFRLVGALFSGVGSKKMAFPDYPALNAQEWDLRYAAVGGTPFTMKDAPPGLFRDLEEAVP